MGRIKMGRLKEVDNTARKFGEALTYIAVWVEDENGKNERPLLFTADAIKEAEERAKKNMEDVPNRDFLTNLFD